MSLYIKNTCLYIWIKKCYIFNIFKEVDFMKKAINKNVKRATALALSMTMLLGLGLSSYAEGEYNVYDEIDTAIIIDDNEALQEKAISISDLFGDGVIPFELVIDGGYLEREPIANTGELITITPKKEEKINPELFEDGAIQKNEKATEEVDDLIKGVTVENEEKPVVLEIHKDDLNALAQSLGENGVDKLLKDTKDNLENLESDLKDADSFQKSADEKLTTVLNTNKDAIVAAANSASSNADSAKANVNAANNAGTLDEATAAKTAAEADLTTANNDLATLTLAFNTASANVEEVSKQLKAAEEDYGKAYDKVVAAKEELKNAKTNSDKALADLKKAEEEMAALDQEVKDLATSQAELQAIQEQQYALMVQYFRDANCAVYDTEGYLDIQASANNISQTKIDSMSGYVANKETGDMEYTGSIKDNEMLLGRYLMKQLVEYMIKNQDGVDPKTVTFSWGDSTLKKNYKDITGWQGTTFMSDTPYKDGKKVISETSEQVAINTQRGIHGGGKTELKDSFTIRQEKSELPDGGRTNRVLVTYTDSEGNSHSEYYNYIFKNSTDLKEGETKTDLTKGIVYLAVVKDDGSGRYLEEVDDENNFSDYSKLVQALELANKAKILKDQYDEALKAVQAAEARTQDLVDQIAKIKITDLAEKSVKLEELKDALKKANEELDKAKEDKTNIEDKIKEVQKAIEDIDLTRFNVVTNDDTTDDTTADPQNIQDPTNPNPGQGQGGAGQQNANIDGQQGQADQDGNEDLIIDDENSATAASVKVADDEGSTKPVFTVTDEASATAASVEEAGANLWWLLLLLLLALMIAFAIYKYAENKRNAEINN
jgi:hypothetical protein